MPEGVYAYTGKFFSDAFSHYGDSGTYRTAKKITGVDFSPYFYHSLRYSFTDYFGAGDDITVSAIFMTDIQRNLRQPLYYPEKEQAASGDLLLVT